MSAEVIAIVISAAALLATFVTMFIGGFAWVIRRMDERFAGSEERLGARIDSVEERLGARIDSVEGKLGARIDGVETKLSDRLTAVERELVEVKIGLARLEGPPRQLLAAR